MAGGGLAAPEPALPAWRAALGTLRGPFLLLTPACVVLGLAAAHWSGQPVAAADAAAVLLGALAAHASVNMLNEWHDWKSGLDAQTQRTPFSGGSGSLQAEPRAAPWVLALGLALLGLAMAVGLALVWRHGLALLPLGLVGVLLVLAYTPWITRHPGLCLLAPGLGFGPLMTAGSAVAVSGRHPGAAYAASLVPLMLVSGLLLLNQFPDVDADRRAGRRHLPMQLGRPRAARWLAALLASAYAALGAGVAAGLLPRGALLGLLVAPLAWTVARDAQRHADDMAALPPVMGRNVAVVLATPVLMALGGWFWR